jgi:thioredoxin 1
MAAPTKPVDVTDADFAQFVKQYPNVVVDAWAPWCGPCKRIAPIMDDLAKEYDGKVAIAKLNTDDNQRTAMQFGIMSIPTLLVFKGGEPVKRLVGAKGKGQLLQDLAEFIA